MIVGCITGRVRTPPAASTGVGQQGVKGALISFSLLIAAQTAAAASLVAGGLEFSDEEGGFVLRDAWGTGTPEDPITLVEEITEEGPAVLTVRGMRGSFGNRATGGHGVGFVLVKIVTNRTSQAWHSFEIEVRELKGRASPFEDGLSFGQAIGPARLFGSDRFESVHVTDEPLDAVVFSGSVIRPGERVTVRVVVTDFSPTWQFYILQRRDSLLAALATSPLPGGSQSAEAWSTAATPHRDQQPPLTDVESVTEHAYFGSEAEPVRKPHGVLLAEERS